MNVKKKLAEIELDVPIFFKMYLFGSSVYADKFNDIDLAIIYDKSQVDIDQVIEFKRKVKSEFTRVFGLSCDVILLTIEEEIEMNFLLNAKTIELKKLHISSAKPR